MSLIPSILAISIAIIIYFSLINLFIVLFRITGLTREKARFQVISMITCAGFTTGESEIITLNNRRRKLAIVCMISGNLFNVLIISLIINLISNISKESIAIENLYWVFIIIGAMLLILIVSKIPFVARRIEKIIEAIGRKIFSSKEKENVMTILDSYDSESIVEIYINRIPEVLENKTLMESNLKNRYSLNLLILKRGNRTIEITKDTVIQNKDSIIVFGNRQIIKDLFTYNSSGKSDEIIVAPKENVVTLIDNYGSDAMAEVSVKILPGILKNKKLYESSIRTQYSLNVIMLKRNDEAIKVTKDTIIEENDVIVVYGNYNSIKKVFLDDDIDAIYD